MPSNKQMKVFSLKSQTQTVFPIHQLNSIYYYNEQYYWMPLSETSSIVLDSKLNFNTNIDQKLKKL